MKKTYEQYAKEFGTTEYEGKEYAIAQAPYITGIDIDEHYEAVAYDKAGNYYSVRWEILEDYDPEINQDESDACDWANADAMRLEEEADDEE